jgi:hypothetical protein
MQTLITSTLARNKWPTLDRKLEGPQSWSVNEGRGRRRSMPCCEYNSCREFFELVSILSDLPWLHICL